MKYHNNKLTKFKPDGTTNAGLSNNQRKCGFTLAEGTTHTTLQNLKYAFTLAEVLITLGIIGVVAAITIPVTIVKHQKQVTAKRLAQTYSILSQAIVHSQTDHGDISSWGMTGSITIDQNNPAQAQDITTAFTDTYLAPYLKLTSKPVYTNNIQNFGYVYPKTKDDRNYRFGSAYILELTNGTTLFVAYNIIPAQNRYSTPNIFVDINGKQGPNILGRDFFLFTFDGINLMRIKPSGYEYNRDDLKNYCAKHSSGEEYENLRCTALIMKDGWEITDDYPW